MEQEEQPSFRRHVEDRRYYEVPARFALNTAYMEVLYVVTYTNINDIIGNKNGHYFIRN